MTDPAVAQSVQIKEHFVRQLVSQIDHLKAEVNERNQQIGELECRKRKAENEIAAMLQPGGCVA